MRRIVYINSNISIISSLEHSTVSAGADSKLCVCEKPKQKRERRRWREKESKRVCVPCECVSLQILFHLNSPFLSSTVVAYHKGIRQIKLYGFRGHCTETRSCSRRSCQTAQHGGRSRQHSQSTVEETQDSDDGYIVSMYVYTREDVLL